jgi:hypothetical protein
MTPDADESHFLKRGCKPHQAAFASRFFATRSEQVMALTAPAGSGKTFTAAEICNFALSSQRAKAILVIVVTADEVTDVANVLQSRNESTPILRTTRRGWWRLEADASVGSNPWPVPGIVILSAATLKHRDVMSGLRLAEWDIIVVHGRTPDTDGSLQAILAANPQARRLCILNGEQEDTAKYPPPTDTDLTATPRDSTLDFWINAIRDSAWPIPMAYAIPTMTSNPFLQALLKDKSLTTAWTDWTNVFKDSFQALSDLPEIRWITYARSKLEARVADDLRKQLRSICRDPACGPQTVALMRAASSSLYCLEQALLDLRATRNRLAHASGPGLQGLNSPAPQLVEASRSLLSLIEQVPHDAKTGILSHTLAAVGRPRDGQARAFVYTRSATTVDYLCTTLAEAGHAVFSVTDRMPFQDQKRAAHDAQAATGVLVLNTVTAIDFAKTSTLVLYDLPEHAASWLLQFVSSTSGVSRVCPDIVSFEDSTDCMPHERIEREAIESGSRLSDDDILRSL